VSKPKNKIKQEPHKNIVSPAETAFKIKYPALLLILAIVLVYAVSINFGYTELDDSIFIRQYHEYNESLSNLVTSFHRGVFDPTQDVYYRPLFLDSMILNYVISEDNIVGYHVVNILMHIIAVLLLFKLFRKLNINELHAFILCLIFAIHPVLSQAVAWIPGRNDVMLAIFTFSFLICSLNYSDDGKTKWLLLSFLWLLAAYFTKETAVFNAVIAFVLIVYLKKGNWRAKRNLPQYIVWILSFIIWYAVRATATLKGSYLSIGKMTADFIHRLPVVIQYLGKIFFPFNLSVFPIMEDTVYYYGIAAVALLVAIIYFTREKNWRAIITGLVLFLLFLLPALLVPNGLNDQVFEHRLYLPITGILFILPYTIVFKNNWQPKRLVAAVAFIALIFGGINYIHQQAFKDPLTFWNKAVATSPHSAYATMMLGEREVDDTAKAYAHIKKAYAMDSAQKYINYYYGMMLQNDGHVLQSEPYFLAEKRISGYYECDFYLARVYLTKGDLKAAEQYLQYYLKNDPENPKANANLLILLINEREKQKAEAQLARMQQIGIPVDGSVIDTLKKL